MSENTLLIRADASSEIGIGHVMRCLALAQVWQEQGGRAVFAMAAGAQQLSERLQLDGVEVRTIAAEPGSAEDAFQTLELRSRLDADWLVLDGYHFSAQYRQAMESEMFHLLLMDDGGDHALCSCDVILNPDPEASVRIHRGEDSRTRFLIGPEYALLRHEFRQFREVDSNPPEKAERILISMGGGDSHNVTLQVLEALQEIKHVQLNLAVVIGASNSHRASLQAAAKASSHPARLLENVTNMPELMAWADLGITAGGGTCYELAFMRCPMFLVAMAKNHERAVAFYQQKGCAVAAGWFKSLDKYALAGRLENVICDGALRRKLVENAAGMIDGRGAERVVEVMRFRRPLSCAPPEGQGWAATSATVATQKEH
jgi:UDP-2,4-diacetamido-2,4,6-trideoxy-beta-L-altropyranose hydrolase